MDKIVVNVVGYIRVSTESQVKQGYSLDEQREEIEKYCDSQNFNLLDVFADEGISGAKANEDEMTVERDGLLDMLAFIREKEIKFVVVLSTNRLWRSGIVKVLIQRELKKNSTDIKAIDRPNYSIYTQNPSEIFMNGMFELLDIYERLEIALKLKRGRIQKAKGGGYAGGGIPFGYYCPHGGKRLLVHKEEAEAVQRVFQLKQSVPNMTLQQISDTMKSEGYRARGGKDFNIMLAKRILDRERFYKGEYVYGGIKSIGVHQPILDITK